MVRTKRVVKIATLSVALLAVAPPAFAAGALDLTFGTNGTTLTSFDTQQQKTVSGVDDQAIQGDGKIVVAGVTAIDEPTPSYDVVVLRYSTDGTLDPTFGTGGAEKIPVGGSASVGGLAIDQKGRILVDGAEGGNGFVIRLTDAGVPDASFGGTGTVFLSPPGHTYTEVRDLLIVGRARPLLVGGSLNSADEDLMLTRLLPSGALDSSFGSSGYSFLTVPGGGSMSGFTSARGPYGTTVVGGWMTPTSGRTSSTLFRFTASGAPDATFSGDGVRPFWVGGPGLAPEPTGIVVRSSGVVVLSNVVPSSGSAVFGLTAFTANGQLDRTFGGGDGKQVYDPTDASDIAHDLALQGDGSLVMVGGSQASALVMRVSASGAPDASFGPGGLVVGAPDPSAYSSASAVSLQGDGKIVTSGGSGKAIFVERFAG